MTTFVLPFVFGAITLGLLSLLKAYGAVPLRELKQRTREGDTHSAALHRVQAYGESTAVLFWFLVGITGALFFWYVAQLSVWLATPVAAGFVWISFVWLPARRTSHIASQAAAALAPVFAWALEYLHAPINASIRFSHRHWPGHSHTGLYDTDDLLDLLQDQYEQADSRIDAGTLQLAMQALTFGHQNVGGLMTPARLVKQVSVDDTIGPVLMNELHASGQTYFPVYEGKENHIVGTLALRDLVNTKATGPVKDHMHPETYYLQEDQPLTDTFEHILEPNRHLFIVVNDLEEYVGVISTEAILRRLVVQPIPEEAMTPIDEPDIDNQEVVPDYSESIDNVAQ